jgi:hypothetical protein
VKNARKKDNAKEEIPLSTNQSDASQFLPLNSAHLITLIGKYIHFLFGPTIKQTG